MYHRKPIFSKLFLANVAWNCFFKLGLLENNFLKENIRYSVSIRTYTISSFLFKVISAKRRKLYDFLQSYTYYICKEESYMIFYNPTLTIFVKKAPIFLLHCYDRTYHLYNFSV